MRADEQRADRPSRRWYKMRRWHVRRRAQLAAEPLCRMCAAVGRITAAEVADHVVPHRDNPHLFWHGALQSLCKRHHDGAKQREEAAAAREARGLR